VSDDADWIQLAHDGLLFVTAVKNNEPLNALELWLLALLGGPSFTGCFGMVSEGLCYVGRPAYMCF
jgi:hypothetical protein